MRRRCAELHVAKMPLATHTEHRLALSDSGGRDRKRAKTGEGPSRALQAKERALTIRVKPCEIGERRSGVAEAELPGRSGQDHRSRRLKRPESRERIARRAAERGTPRHSRVNANGIEQRAVGAQREQTVGTPVLVIGVRDSGSDERSRLASDGARVKDFHRNSRIANLLLTVA